MRAATLARRLLLAVLVFLLLTWIFKAPFSLLGTANLALLYAMVGASLVLLTGWVGQISLAQASFVGIGAFVTGLLVRGWHIPFPLTLPIAAGIACVVAALLGLVALRVRGLYLAVATLIFAWMTQAYLFSQAWFGGAGGSSSAKILALGDKGTWPYIDLANRKTFYYVALAALATALLAAANLRESKTGRAWFAVRGSEIAAASLGVDVTRYKLLAFATSGFLAGAAGSLMMTHQQVVSATSFSIPVSLFFLSIAVVGGLGKLGGAVAAAVLFAGLEEVFYRVEAFSGLLDVVSAVLLGAVLLFFPAGLAGIPPKAAPVLSRISRLLTESRASAAGRMAIAVGRMAIAVGAFIVSWARWLRARRDRLPVKAPGASTGRPAWFRRLPLPARRSKARVAPDALSLPLSLTQEASPGGEAEPVLTLHYEPGTATRPELPTRALREPVLASRDITVRFGGLVAVNDASLEVRKGEIVGLIGPNGAGKTTLFNAISGLNQPASGTVELYGQDLTPLPVHERARLGMGRTFQVLQLFPQLTVFDNLLVATHSRNPTGYLSHLLHTYRALIEERNARERCIRVVELLGLSEVAGRRVAGLPFGTLRRVELARALVTGAPFVMLDEPVSGLDNTETDALMDLLFWLRQTLGLTLLVIEHDVRMVTGVSDYMYVIDRGQIIAEGTPQDIQRDPAVIAAYLGDVTPAGKDTPAEDKVGADR